VTRRHVIATLALASACSRSHADSETRDKVATAPSAAAATAASPVKSPDSSVSPTSSSGGAIRWHGSYKSASGELYIPPDWKNVRWNVKESAAGLGDGAMSVSIDSASGRALGSLDGPLGPAVIDGFVSEGKLTATIARKDPADLGFTGTLVGVMQGDHSEGTMNVSLADANAIRRATFTLSPEAPVH
jgi:hypothetical protein